MFKNSNLKESLQSLTQATYLLFNKELYLADSYKKDSSSDRIAIVVHKTEPKIKEIPEFNICTELMMLEDKIKALQGELVGTFSGLSSVPDEETCILSFLKQVYLASRKYDQAIFDKKYQLFEDLFYSERLVFKDTANLYNFSFNKNELALGHEISIRKAEKQINQESEYLENKHNPYSLFTKSSYVIERNYKNKKIVGGDTIIDAEKKVSELSETHDLFDQVINSLRILKLSGVYRDHRIKTEQITFHPLSGTITRSPFFENTVLGEKCKIKKTDVALLCEIFDFLCNENDSRFKVASRRLSLGIERKSLEDKLIDYMIGLEALYLPDGSAELSFRLSVRVAFLLSSKIERKNTYEFLKKIYDVRSSIVHGNKYELNIEDIRKLEELLRKSVILWIKDKNNFSITEKTNSGKVRKEGKLNTMLFDI